MHRLDFQHSIPSCREFGVSSSASTSAAQAALIRELARVHRLHGERAANPILAGALDRLALWQGRRLRGTYTDLAADPRYAGAIAYFQNDLYGPTDNSRRDHDLARVVPIMVRILPEAVVGTVAHAMELSALSQELDRALLSRLPRTAQFTVAEYCKAYRRAANFPLRRRQIELIVDVGAALDRHVDKPLVRAALSMMRQPARLAGLAPLQNFLERGFAAFRAMHGAADFLRIINERETGILEVIAGGALAPFPDPLASPLSGPAPSSGSR